LADSYPFLISIPHGGFIVPGEVTDLIALGTDELRYYSDPAVREIYDFRSKISGCIDTPISRMVVDLNRPPYHLAPRYPDGAIKSLTGHKTPVYKDGKFPGINTIHGLMVDHYFPFQEEADRLIDEKDIQVAFDCHSMLPYGLPSQPDAGKKRPAICLSNNGDTSGWEKQGVLATCSGDFMQVLREHFMDQFASDGEVLFNTPFGGGFISIAHHWHRKTPWIQIEVNRALYEEQTEKPGVTGTIDFEKVSGLNKRIWMAITGFWDEVQDK
jgi:N-formylglutamate deformylase